MAFTAPQFNLRADIWSTGPASAGPADIVDQPCAKYIFSRTDVPVTPPWTTDFWSQWHPIILLRFPFADPWDTTVPNLYGLAAMIECPRLSNSYYLVRFAEIMHEGFPNQYVLFGCVQCRDDGTALEPTIP